MTYEPTGTVRGGRQWISWVPGPSVACLDQTLEIEHAPVYDKGVLIRVADRRVDQALAEYKMNEDALRTEPIPV